MAFNVREQSLSTASGEPVFFTTREAGGGDRAGLSICYGIVKEHGGCIWVESPGSNGSIFTVELPLAEVAPVLSGEGPSERYGGPVIVQTPGISVG